jgi:4-aminobutyrate aminotransferase-like enzyme
MLVMWDGNIDFIGAVQRQLNSYNGNTRYLHPMRAMLAQRLLSKFDSSLSVVFFVNSGSEANDLALRLAQTYTGHSDCVVVDRAYHGHTSSTLSLSPYKYEHVGGHSYAKDNVHKVRCPDMYRGPYADELPSEAARLYSQDMSAAVKDAVKRNGGVAAFFIESGMSVAGVILPPPGYLKTCFDLVRAAGGLCVCDEVQTGFARFGKHFWGFEQQAVVPDIVTMGKAMGNGFPLAAVVTTPEIARAFQNGLEYFNTFGGNPVACAAGLAVLDIIDLENLQCNALEVGTHLLQLLQSLSASEAGYLIGDIRGIGLFIGVEFVTDRKTKTPATRETSWLCSWLKDEHRILTSIDGAFDNVLVIKPPLSFTHANAEELVNAMQAALIALKVKPLDLAGGRHGHTPT